MLYQSEFVKKTIRHQSSKVYTGKKELFKLNTEKSKGGTLLSQKKFVTDFDEIQKLAYLGPKNSTHEI